MKAIIESARRFALLFVVAGLAACATVDPNADLAEMDKYEGVSRDIHEFNVGVDRILVRPMAQGYEAVTPTLIKHLLGNGFSHLSLPRDFANHLLQGEIKPALETLGRFTINTIIGAGGLLDPATEFGLKKRKTDFGVTLARHGVGEGAYFVVPLFGPTTTRAAVGSIVDLAFAPTTYLGYVDPRLTPVVPAAIYGTKVVDYRYNNMQAIDDILYESQDSYVSLRAVYIQRRRALAAGDERKAESLPDIFESK